jgi:predicted ATP-grasp superfamily ATP-dependent carboligase
MSLDKAEKKAEMLENELTDINQEWMGMMEEVQKQTEHFMSENEMKEF